jgi:two-component system NtrC family response regulator
VSKAGKKILIVDDDASLRSQLAWAFDEHEVFQAEDRLSAIVAFRRVRPDVVLLDLGLPPNVHSTVEGLMTLEAIRLERPEAKVIVITGQDDRETAREVISRGAYDFFSKPPDLEQVRLIVARALSLVELEDEYAELAEHAGKKAPIAGVIAQSVAMRDVCQKVERLAPTHVSVMLLGDSGTGKELLARALHDLSQRKSGPFVAINCAAIPTQLLESELFGHEKGAFTGAHKLTQGKVELANGGTLFLDEIGELDPAMQSKLLRFLQQRSFERVGGRATIEVDVRVVSATNRDLETAQREGGFREDLYFRLREVALFVPPLRDREDDAALLARYFVRTEAKAMGVAPRKIGLRALSAIRAYAWPGNVRELQNRTRRALALCDRDILQPADFELPEPADEGALLPTLREVRQRAERELIQKALASTNGKVADAARKLGISRPTLYELLHSLDIPLPRS